MKIVGLLRNLGSAGLGTLIRGLHQGLLTTVAMLAVAAPVQAAEPNSADIEVAKSIANSVCAACHGEDGNSTAPRFPRLAGLAREYLAKQLTEFMSGKRKNDMMAASIAGLKPEEVVSLSHYYNKLRFKPDPSEDGKLNEEGELLFVLGNETTGVPACTGCHGQNGEGIATVPRITGQNSEYLLLQLKNFNIGIRTNDPNRFMQSIAQRMTEQEMKAVARYVSGLEFKPKF